MSAITSRKSDQFPLRFPDGMRDAIKSQALASGRSMNAEIIYQLGQIYSPERKTADELKARSVA